MSKANGSQTATNTRVAVILIYLRSMRSFVVKKKSIQSQHSTAGETISHELYCNMHTLAYFKRMKLFDWNDDKNEWLRKVRGITFDDILFHLSRGALLDTVEHPNQEQYSGQRIFIIDVEGYVYLVPFAESDETFFLKTIIPSRKMTEKYLGGDPT